MTVQSTPTVKEGTPAYLTVTFKDKTGEVSSPYSARYRIDCLTSGVEIKDWTALTPGSSIEIVLSSVDNNIYSNSHAYELRLVTVEATYTTLTDLDRGEYVYRIERLRKVDET